MGSLLGKMHVFRTLQEWTNFHKENTDFTLSSRIHGCIASLLAGKPALLIQHDQRTRELAETMGVSSISLKEAYRNCRLFSRDRLVSQRFLKACYDEQAFAARAAQNHKAILQFYQQNGLQTIVD
jgi:polysaccharide pyruvyl transferase WcaK-like protein